MKKFNKSFLKRNFLNYLNLLAKDDLSNHKLCNE